MAGTWTVMEPVPGLDDAYQIMGADEADGYIWALLYHIQNGFTPVRYDPDSDTWTATDDLTPLTYGSGALATKQFRRMGDWLYYQDTVLLIAYNFKTDTWTGVSELESADDPNLGDPNLRGRWYNAAAWPLTDDKMAYLGGGMNTWYARGQISTYTRSTDSWHYGGGPWLTIGAQNNEHYVGRIGNKIYTRRGSTGVDGYETHFEVDVPTTLSLGHPATVDTTNISSWRWIGGCSDGTYLGEYAQGMWRCGGHSWAGSSADSRLFYWEPGDSSWTDMNAGHPQSQGTHSLHMMRCGDYIWTVGGAFDTRRNEYSLCRYEPATPLPLIPTYKAGWGILARSS